MKIKIQERNDGEWHVWYAWHPVLTPTAVVWFDRVERRWNHDFNVSGDFSGYTFAAGGWEYREVA
jgi:hypothetical protein